MAVTSRLGRVPRGHLLHHSHDLSPCGRPRTAQCGASRHVDFMRTNLLRLVTHLESRTTLISCTTLRNTRPAMSGIKNATSIRRILLFFLMKLSYPLYQRPSRDHLARADARQGEHACHNEASATSQEGIQTPVRQTTNSFVTPTLPTEGGGEKQSEASGCRWVSTLHVGLKQV